MRASRINLTVSPKKYYDFDKRRGLISIRNLHATDTILFQGGAGDKTDMYPILAGDVLTLETGDLRNEIWLCADTVAHDDVIVLVT